MACFSRFEQMPLGKNDFKVRAHSAGSGGTRRRHLACLAGHHGRRSIDPYACGVGYCAPDLAEFASAELFSSDGLPSPLYLDVLSFLRCHAHPIRQAGTTLAGPPHWKWPRVVSFNQLTLTAAISCTISPGAAASMTQISRVLHALHCSGKLGNAI